MKRFTANHFMLLSLLAFSILSCTNPSNGKDPDKPGDNGKVPELSLETITDLLVSPVAMAVPDDGSNRIFVCEQRGLVKVLKDKIVLPDPLLDIRNKLIPMNENYTERGLLGIALHPDFEDNGKFYVYYSAPSNTAGSDHKSILAEYSVSTENPNVANTNERVLMEIEEPESNHNGGQLAFGPDGYLYIAVGDGGGGGDKHGEIGNGQNLNTLLGKILRIDVNASSRYSIPDDNPFVDKAEARDEIWAYGLRNPWRFSFDRKDGRLFAADVGQNKYEEVDIIVKGGNYGWRIMEGTHCFNPSANCNQKGLILPIDEYSHDVGISITGGYVYRGSDIPELHGKYVFADWTGPVFYLTQNGDKFTRERMQFSNKPNDLRVLSFGEDNDGNLYMLTSKGTTPLEPSGALYKIVK